MKFLSTLAAIAVCTISLTAQTFSTPESVEYDVAGNRWFVGMTGSHAILQHSPGSNTLLPFATGCTSGPHGLEIMGTTLYACDGGRIRGFDLATGTMTFNLNLGASFLNGLTTDGSMYLFATDYSAKKIYRICPSTNTFNVMCTIVKSPNGIYYDGPNNRLVYVTWGSNAPIQAMLLSDSTYSTVLATTLGNCDGITRDAAGYWYVTAWTGAKLAMLDPGLTTAPVTVLTGLSSPADIDINGAGDSIGIPNSVNPGSITYYTLSTSIEAQTQGEAAAAYPNPATESSRIVIHESVQDGTAEVYGMDGRLIRKQAFNGNTCTIGRDNLADGTYMVVIYEGDRVYFQGKIVFACKE